MSDRSRRISCLLVLAVLSATVAATRAAAQDDHPLVSRYEGSVLKDKDVAGFNEYKLVTGRNSKGELEGMPVKGKVTRLVYQNPPGRSTLEIFRNYQHALSDAGAVVLYACALDECGPAYARSAWSRYNGLFAAADGDPRYLSARVARGGATAYVAIMVGKSRTQLDVVEVGGMEENLVVVDAATLGQGIDRDGKVRVYGILFDTDKAELKPESTPALDEIAKLLRERPALRLYVVGHTDLAGPLPHNQTLSEARARSVARALVERYGIAADRLEGYGVGPLAPVATNASDAGRAKNRRVELVAR